jgi:uncharacterized OB-fold protein
MGDALIDPRQLRIPPLLTDLNRPFWSGGSDGRLLIQRCTSCLLWIHPPSPICRRCHSMALEARPVSGTATVVTYTINRQQWGPTEAPPYAIAIVELPEQEGLRLTTNIVGCELDQISIGMAVRVCFAPLDDVWLPLFQPA